MKVEFLGTGASEGIPALFCQCEYCNAARKRGEIRSRSQILFDGELSLDFPADAFYHAARSGVDFSAIRYLLATHSHMDHFAPADLMLRGYKYAVGLTSPTLDIYANAECLEVFRETTRREIKPEIAESIRLHEIRAYEKTSFGGWTVYPLKAKHTSRDPLLFLLEKDGKRILHLHDTALPGGENDAFLRSLGIPPVELVILDCTFLFDRGDEKARHMGVYEDAELLDRLEKIGAVDGHTKRVATHFSHSHAPSPERVRAAEERFGLIAAYDGMKIEI